MFAIFVRFLVPPELLAEVDVVERIVGSAVYAQLRNFTSIFLLLEPFLISLSDSSLLGFVAFVSAQC